MAVAGAALFPGTDDGCAEVAMAPGTLEEEEAGAGTVDAAGAAPVVVVSVLAGGVGKKVALFPL